MKIAILGGTGYIGSELNKIIAADVYNSKNIHSFFEKITQYDVIFHLADCRLHEYTEQVYNEIALLNKKIIDTISNKTVLIYFSSCSVYGVGTNLDEKSPVTITSLYASSKINSENILKNHNKLVILRLGTLFGYSSNYRNDLLINNIVSSIIKNKPVDIYNAFDNRPYLYIAHLISNIKILIKNTENFNNKTFNLITFNADKFDLIRLITQNNLFGTYNFIKQKEVIVRNYTVNTELALSSGFLNNFDSKGSIGDFIDVMPAQS